MVSELASNAVEHAGTDFVVTVSRGAETVTVTAQGTAPSLVPFDLPQLRSHLTGPVEKVTAP